MIRVKDIHSKIKSLASEDLAEKWDNVGLLLGDSEQEVKKILLCLDITSSVVSEAKKKNVDLIISHHPLIFKPIKNINFSDFRSKIIRELIKNDISVISAHTNLDSAKLGLNDYLAKLLNLEDISVLFESNFDREVGLGRIGRLKKPLELNEFINLVKTNLSLNYVKLVSKEEKKISTVAVLGGSGGSFVYNLPKVDVYLTGDIGYHEAQDALEMGYTLIDIGHFAEKVSKELLSSYLKSLNYSDIEIFISDVEKEPFEIR